MIIHYKCRCQTSEQTVTVPDRPADTDVIVWMELVVKCISYDHHAKAPRCGITEMEYAKIPYPEGSTGVGVPIVKN